ncbi:MAG TPA: GWxTD domain-containing protein [Vicinamibacteria bacterium]
MFILRSSPRTTAALLLLGAALTAASPTAVIPQDPLESLPEEYRDWLEKEVVYIITDREREAFLELGTIGEWDAFIEAFWRRRDPDRLTPANELRDEHYRRIDFANRELGRESAVPGWMTDRGKMYIILGEPDSRESFTGVGWIYPTELWFYLADRETGLPPIYLLFFREGVAGPYQLFNHAIDQMEDLVAGPQQIDPNNPRLSIYQKLQTVSPELAHASVSMQADRGGYSNVMDPTLAGLDTQIVLAQIYETPFRRLDTSYVDAARDARGLVETDYLFNYVPNMGAVDVLPGPDGTSFVHYSIEIEPQHLTLVHDEDQKTYYTRLVLQGEVTTLDERPVVQLNRDVYVNLTEAQFPDVSYRPFSYRDMFPLVPGAFHFRVVLKNEARHEYTIFETSLQVQDRSSAPSLDVPVLLYGSERQAGGDGAYRSYQLGTLRRQPNAKRVYAAGDTLEAYVPVENASGQHQLSLRVVNQVDPTQTLVSRSAAIADYAGEPIVATLSLAEMVGGRYQLIAELSDPAGEVVDTRSADFEISPRAEILRPWVAREGVEGENQAVVQAALADQYLRLGDVAKAREASQKALEANPDLTAPRLNLAVLLLGEGRPDEAVRLLEPAYVRDPENVDLMLALGDTQYQLKNYRRAAELLEASLVRRRPTTAILNALAVCYGEMGQRDKVLEYIERSLQLDPDQEPVKALKEHLESSPPPGNR